MGEIKKGLRAEGRCEVRRGRDDYLVVAHGTCHPLFSNYHKWRINYCNNHRNNHTWLRFREGKVDPITLLYALILKIKEGK